MSSEITMHLKEPARSWLSYRTVLLINLAAIMEAADERLLPAVYREVGLAFKATPSMLGSLTFVRAFVQALASPLAGFLAMHYDRATVIGLGTVFWSISTLAVGISSTYHQAILARAVNGVGLAIVIPAIQSFVADSNEEGGRGMAFGWLNLTGSIGGIGGATVATLLAAGTYWGYEGWRFAFFLMASVSSLVGWLVYAFVVDPRPIPAKSGGQGGLQTALQEAVAALRKVIKLRTFQLIIVQGVIGSVPWQSFVFFTMWLQLVGFGHGGAAFLMGLFSLGCALGALFGGWLGDRASKQFPNSGRIICAQISAGSGAPWCLLVLILLPQDPAWLPVFGAMLFLMGLTVSWCQSATNNPIFADIVPPNLRTTVYAYDRAFEGSISALAPPLVGILAEAVYGYKLDPTAAERPDPQNARALSRGLFWVMAPSFLACLSVYGLIYNVYKHDRNCARTKPHLRTELSFTSRNRVSI